CVYCPRGVRVQRLTARDSIDEKQANAIIDAQIPDTERCTIADYIVPSDRKRDEFAAEIKELIGEIIRQ
ncbi:MAG: dephospho-CoA kinase, partial [Clostridiales bacterium]|nr:dephospho-CoA kinase [Clostridiales bacterium]